MSDNLNENETIVTIRLPKEHYKAAVHIAYILGYHDFEEYVNRAVKQKIIADLDGAGELELDSNSSFYERMKQNRIGR